MGTPDYLRFILSLAFVLGLMGLLGYILKRTDLAKLARGGTNKRLNIIETRTIDVRHKLAIIKCDDREHLVMMGPNGHTVIDANIPAKPASLPKDATT